jgi:hypothetical protein
MDERKTPKVRRTPLIIGISLIIVAWAIMTDAITWGTEWWLAHMIYCLIPLILSIGGMFIIFYAAKETNV